MIRQLQPTGGGLPSPATGANNLPNRFQDRHLRASWPRPEPRQSGISRSPRGPKAPRKAQRNYRRMILLRDRSWVLLGELRLQWSVQFWISLEHVGASHLVRLVKKSTSTMGPVTRFVVELAKSVKFEGSPDCAVDPLSFSWLSSTRPSLGWRPWP